MKLLITTCIVALSPITLFADRILPTTPEELTATVEQAFANADIEIAEIIAVPDEQRTFANTVGALDDMMARLDGDANIMAFMVCF